MKKVFVILAITLAAVVYFYSTGWKPGVDFEDLLDVDMDAVEDIISSQINDDDILRYDDVLIITSHRKPNQEVELRFDEDGGLIKSLSLKGLSDKEAVRLIKGMRAGRFHQFDKVTIVMEEGRQNIHLIVKR